MKTLPRVKTMALAPKTHQQFLSTAESGQFESLVVLDNAFKYTPAGGTAELKKAVCERHASDFGTDYKPSECLITGWIGRPYLRAKA